MRLPLPVRRLAARALGWIPVRIRSGPNAGCRWSLAASGRHVGGRFESERMEAILSIVSEGDCVWDGGAHHGYVTLAASRAVGPEGRVYAFEPSAYNRSFLRRHVAWNGLDNVEIVATALGDRDGSARFGGRGSSHAFRLGAGSREVEVRSLGGLLAEGLRPPDVVKLDVEGAEGDVLETGSSHLPPARAVVIASVHSREACERATVALAARGFTILESPELRRMRERGTWGTHDPDFVAVGPGRPDRVDGLHRLGYEGLAP